MAEEGRRTDRSIGMCGWCACARVGDAMSAGDAGSGIAGDNAMVAAAGTDSKATTAILA